MAEYNAKALKTAIDIAEAGKHQPVVWSIEYFNKLREEHGDLFDEIVKAFAANVMSEEGNFIYRCEKISAPINGAGTVQWNMTIIDPNGFYVPGHSITISTPHEKIDAALKTSNPEVAISKLLINHKPHAWNENELRELQYNNYRSLVSKDSVDLFVQAHGGYPYDTVLDK